MQKYFTFSSPVSNQPGPSSYLTPIPAFAFCACLSMTVFGSWRNCPGRKAKLRVLPCMFFLLFFLCFSALVGLSFAFYHLLNPNSVLIFICAEFSFLGFWECEDGRARNWGENMGLWFHAIYDLSLSPILCLGFDWVGGGYGFVKVFIFLFVLSNVTWFCLYLIFCLKLL